MLDEHIQNLLSRYNHNFSVFFEMTLGVSLKFRWVQYTEFDRRQLITISYVEDKPVKMKDVLAYPGASFTGLY